jgi:hypothetical protein
MHWKPRNIFEIRVDRTTLLTKKGQKMLEPSPVGWLQHFDETPAEWLLGGAQTASQRHFPLIGMVSRTFGSFHCIAPNRSLGSGFVGPSFPGAGFLLQ